MRETLRRLVNVYGSQLVLTTPGSAVRVIDEN